MRKRAFVYLGIVILLSGLIVFTSTNSGAAHSEAGGRIIGWINTYIFNGRLSQNEQSSIVGIGAKLFGHFSLYLLTGLFSLLFVKELPQKGKNKYMGLISYGLLLSILGEVIQIFSQGRSPLFSDVLLDFSGFILIPLCLYILSFEKPQEGAR